MAAAFEPSKYIGVEGGFLLNDSDTTLAFDPEDDKFGDLDSLKPGDEGWLAAIEFGSRIDPTWDYRVGATLIDLGTGESIDDEDASAATKLRIGYADLEVGYRPDFGSGLALRIFGGVRSLYASGTSSFEDGSDKLGQFDDDTWAIGPRVGVGVAVPVIADRGISVVGSVAGAALFGSRDTDYRFTNDEDAGDNKSQSFSNSVTVWNVDAMAGLSIPLTSAANVTLGYKAQAFGNIVGSRSDVDEDGDYTDNSDGDVLVHGPFVKMTIALE